MAYESRLTLTVGQEHRRLVLLSRSSNVIVRTAGEVSTGSQVKFIGQYSRVCYCKGKI